MRLKASGACHKKEGTPKLPCAEDLAGSSKVQWVVLLMRRRSPSSARELGWSELQDPAARRRRANENLGHDVEKHGHFLIHRECTHQVRQVQSSDSDTRSDSFAAFALILCHLFAKSWPLRAVR